MTVYELIQELVSHPPETEVIFKCNDETIYYCDFRYKKLMDELHIQIY